MERSFVIYAMLIYPHSSHYFLALTKFETTHKCQVLVGGVNFCFFFSCCFVFSPVYSSGSHQVHVNDP